MKEQANMGNKYIQVGEPKDPDKRKTVSVGKHIQTNTLTDGDEKRSLGPTAWVLIGLTVAVLAIGILGSLFDGDNGSSTAVSSRCQAVPVEVTAAINSAWDGDGLSLGKTRAIVSNDFERAFFVSGFIRGPGMGSATIGTWLVSGTPSDPGLYLSVNAMANEFSVFPVASGTDAGATMSDDGARESQACL